MLEIDKWSTGLWARRVKAEDYDTFLKIPAATLYMSPSIIGGSYFCYVYSPSTDVTTPSFAAVGTVKLSL
jgi:hypothetical protein